MQKKNFLLFFLYLAVFDFVYNDLKKWRKANSTTHGVWLAPGFQSQRGCVLPSLSISFDTGTNSHRVTKFRLPLLGSLDDPIGNFSNCLPIFYTLQRIKTGS